MSDTEPMISKDVADELSKYMDLHQQISKAKKQIQDRSYDNITIQLEVNKHPTVTLPAVNVLEFLNKQEEWIEKQIKALNTLARVQLS